MGIAVIGGGPAGLYFAYLMKKNALARDVTVYEGNPADATYGFGVVFSENALAYLDDADPASYRRIAPHMETWADQTIVHRDESVRIDGQGFSSIGRKELLGLLQALCTEAGVELRYQTAIRDIAALRDRELVVGADGANSVVRNACAPHFGPRVEQLSNRFAWYGTPRAFDTLTLTFRENENGCFVAHHYRFRPDMSTFIVECDERTWRRAGLDRMSDRNSRAYCEEVFAPDLQGHGLVSNKSIWRRFPVITNERWHGNRLVLIGDALRTVHFSIGSGTRLALEDAIALFRALERSGTNVADALERFEAERRPVVDKLLDAAASSYDWYERLPEKAALPPYRLAHDYMVRSGRVSDERLERVAPLFMHEYRRRHPPQAASTPTRTGNSCFPRIER